MVAVAVAAHDVVTSVAVSVTVAIPGVEYTIPVGFCVTAVDGEEPAPKFHAQVTPAAVPVLVKSTGRPSH